MWQISSFCSLNSPLWESVIAVASPFPLLPEGRMNKRCMVTCDRQSYHIDISCLSEKLNITLIYSMKKSNTVGCERKISTLQQQPARNCSLVSYIDQTTTLLFSRDFLHAPLISASLWGKIQSLTDLTTF